MIRFVPCLLVLAHTLMLLVPSPTLAYLGPGAGLGLIGSLIAVLVVGLIVVFGLVLYPIRLLRKRRSRAGVADGRSNAEG